MDIIRAKNSIHEGTENFGTHSLGYYVLQKQKPLFEKNVQKEKAKQNVHFIINNDSKDYEGEDRTNFTEQTYHLST